MKALEVLPQEPFSPRRRDLVATAAFGLLASTAPGPLRGRMEVSSGRDAIPPVPPLPPNPLEPAPLPEPSAPAAEVLRVGPARALRTVAAAAQLAGDGAVVEIDPGDYVADVATWSQRHITIRGRGCLVRMIADGASAEGKSIWVMRCDEATIEGIEFIGARAADRNGAGIRLERGRLLVRRCRFFDNQMGILTSNDAASALAIEDCEFSHHHTQGALAHALYAGRIAELRVSGSWFHNGHIGHLVKSRARLSRVEYNLIADGDGTASYELEFPDGGIANVIGNVVQQGSGTRNWAIVSYGAESLHWSTNEIALAHNTLVNDRRLGGLFVRAVNGTAAVVIRNNLWVGPGGLRVPGGADLAGNLHASRDDLDRAPQRSYRPSLMGRARLERLTLSPLPHALQPSREYVHPVGTRALAGSPRWPGAMQSV